MEVGSRIKKSYAEARFQFRRMLVQVKSLGFFYSFNFFSLIVWVLAMYSAGRVCQLNIEVALVVAGMTLAWRESRVQWGGTQVVLSPREQSRSLLYHPGLSPSSLWSILTSLALTSPSLSPTFILLSSAITYNVLAIYNIIAHSALVALQFRKHIYQISEQLVHLSPLVKQ